MVPRNSAQAPPVIFSPFLWFFFIIWARTSPFGRLSNEFTVQRLIREGHRPERPQTQIGMPAEIEEEFWGLVVDMWAHDPSRRPLTDDVQRRLEGIFGLLLEQRSEAKLFANGFLKAETVSSLLAPSTTTIFL